MIDLLIEAEDENGKKLEDVHIIDLLIINLLAGHESSAHASMWAVLYLNQHPEMLQKAKVSFFFVTFFINFIYKFILRFV